MGVACPQVSQITMAFAPQAMAVLYIRWMVSGSQRVRVFGHVHHVETERDRILHGILGSAQQEVVSPILRIAPDGAGADKRRRLDGNASALHDLGDGPNVILMGAGGAVGLDLHLGPANLARQGFAVRQGAGTGPRQADIERIDAKPLHQMEDLDLLFDGRIADRGRLQAVTQRFVIQQDLAGRYHRAGIDRVPVVNQISNFGGHC